MKTEVFHCEHCGSESPIDKVTAEFDEKNISEAASMVCPVCNSKYEINAQLVQPGTAPEGGEEKPEEEPETEPEGEEGGEEGGEANASVEPAGGETPAGGEGADQIEPMESISKSVDKAFKALGEGQDLNDILRLMLGAQRPVENKVLTESDEKENWEGDFATFSSKLFGLSDNLGLGMDELEDLISKMQEEDAMCITGEQVQVCLKDMRKVLTDFLSAKKTNADVPQASSEPPPPAMPVGLPPEAPLPQEEPSVDLGGRMPVGEAKEEDPEDEEIEKRVDKAMAKFFESLNMGEAGRDIQVASYEVFRDQMGQGWNVFKAYTEATAKNVATYLSSQTHTQDDPDIPTKYTIRKRSTFVSPKRLIQLRKEGIRVEVLDKGKSEESIEERKALPAFEPSQPDAEGYEMYLRDTLIPDLRASGSEVIAEEFETIADMLQDGHIDESYLNWLEETCITDLIADGMEATAMDVQEGVYWIRKQAEAKGLRGESKEEDDEDLDAKYNKDRGGKAKRMKKFREKNKGKKESVDEQIDALIRI